MAKAKSHATHKTVSIDSIIPNPDNPRSISQDNFDLLKKSITELPKMLEVKPIAVNEDMMVVGGNQRLEVMKELNYKKVNVVILNGWSPDEVEQFVIKDNTHFGEWVWSMLDSTKMDQLTEWGLDTQDWEDSQFKPNFNPQSEKEEYNQNDVESAQVDMGGSFHGGEGQILKEVVCPHCLESFKIAQ